MFPSLSVPMSLLPKGQQQLKDFWTERLIFGKIPITDPIKKNSFAVPGTITEKNKEEEKKLV